MKVGEYRKFLAAKGATWTLDPSLDDNEELPLYATGDNQVMVPSRIPKTDWKQIVGRRTNNLNLLRRRIARGFISPDEAERDAIPGTSANDDSGGGGTTATSTRPSIVDWRNRWGANWVTSVRDQAKCNACWAFAATALIESMARIEQKLWCWRSEGDVHAGMNYPGTPLPVDCNDSGNPGMALDWIVDNGLADPGCFSWAQAVNDNAPYTPTSDRPGRIVPIPEWTSLDPPEDGYASYLKDHLDAVGPFVTRIADYNDFHLPVAPGTIYHHDPASSDDYAGHYLLVVGYNDTEGYWIVKNSWGSGWNKPLGGFAYIGYGECRLDDRDFFLSHKHTVHIADPDAWTRRRQHGGNIIENIEVINGERRDRFIMLQATGNKMRHWWRENWTSGLPWQSDPTLVGTDVASHPTLTATTFGGNYECVYLTTAKRLYHRYYTQSSRKWSGGVSFGPTDAAGVPGFLQSSYKAPGNFEVVVRTADSKLAYWYRDNVSPWTWTAGPVRFGSNIAYSGPTLVQHSGGNLEFVCVTSSGQMQHWYRDGQQGEWKTLSTFGSQVKSSPCMIIGQTGAANEQAIGNYELCVAVSGKIQYWNHTSGTPGFTQTATFGHDVAQVVGLLQGSFFFDLELIVVTTGGKLQHYWKDSKAWHEGVVIG